MSELEIIRFREVHVDLDLSEDVALHWEGKRNIGVGFHRGQTGLPHALERRFESETPWMIDSEPVLRHHRCHKKGDIRENSRQKPFQPDALTLDLNCYLLKVKPGRQETGKVHAFGSGSIDMPGQQMARKIRGLPVSPGGAGQLTAVGGAGEVNCRRDFVVGGVITGVITVSRGRGCCTGVETEARAMTGEVGPERRQVNLLV
mmetsp:Transcript_4913/g.11949  ORF Transcript_4913/g.11949 Transcript_4913/m.11949 type:complete len:203 (+) Transcript_4913:168-776(+)